MGYALDRGLFRSMRRNGISLIAQMVITIGLSILLRYLYLYNFGGNPRFFRNYSAQTALSIGPIDITPKDLIATGISVIVLLLVGALLQLTRIGKAMRAVADNRDLAESSGIDVQKVISVVWIAGGALAALGGVFFGLDQIKWDFGFRILLLIFAAVTLGGLGTAYGALVGALVVGLVINLSTLFIDAELKNMVALLVLVLILLFRPQGILGQSGEGGLMIFAIDWDIIFTQIFSQAFGTQAMVFALAAIGLNIHYGYTGLLNFGQVGFMAAGAYGVGMSVLWLDIGFWPGILVGILYCLGLALMLGIPTLRLRADYLGITTIAASETIRLFVRWRGNRERTGAAEGINDFADPFFDLRDDLGILQRPGSVPYRFLVFEYRADDLWVMLVGWIVVGLCLLFTWQLMRSPWGRVLKAIREDEDAARALGKNAYSYKLQALAIGGVIGGLGRHAPGHRQAVGPARHLQPGHHLHDLDRADHRWCSPGVVAGHRRHDLLGAHLRPGSTHAGADRLQPRRVPGPVPQPRRPERQPGPVHGLRPRSHAADAVPTPGHLRFPGGDGTR